MVDLKVLQEKQIEIMDAIHKVCCENNITYYLIAGSCLGAIRHGGFIPWDVDIDVAMPRNDYERFFKIADKKLSYDFVTHTYLTDANHDKPHGLVCMRNSVLLRDSNLTNSHLPKYGIFIDVFPLDKCPDDKCAQNKHRDDYLRVKQIKKLKLSCIYKENSWIQKLAKYLIRLFFAPLSVRTINKWQQKIMMRYVNLEPCHFLCSIGSKYKYEKQLMPIEYYGTPKLAKFENREYYIPAQPEKYLTKLYGDYMKLPSKEEQEKLMNYYTCVEIK